MENNRWDENTVHNSLNIYKNIFDASDVGISVVSSEAKFVFVNDAYCSFYGRTCDELINRHISTVLDEEKLEGSLKRLSDLLETGKPVAGETKITRDDGSEIYLKVSKKRIYSDEGIPFRLTTVTDITTQKKTEQLQSILLDISHQAGYDQNPLEIYQIIREEINEIMPAENFSISLIDHKTGKYTMLNKEAFETRSYRSDNYEFKSLLDFVTRIKMSLMITCEKIDKLIEQGEIEPMSRIPKVWLGVPLHIHDKIIGIISIYSIADEVKISIETKEIFEFISDQVAHVIERKITEEEILKAKLKAEESDRLKSEFLTQISHEIRTPINSILSFSQLLRSELEPMVTDELKDSFLMIERGGKRLVRTIDLILNMSQIQNYEKLIEYRPLDLENDVLTPIIVQMKNFAKNKGLEIQLHNEIPNTEIICDYYSINQIFLNLIENAIKFTNAGHVLCKILKGENTQVRVDIEDTGIGISEEYIPQLFEAFSQEETGYTRRYEGNGLGLALVKKFAELNNAIVEVRSKKGNGSVFSVVFQNS